MLVAALVVVEGEAWDAVSLWEKSREEKSRKATDVMGKLNYKAGWRRLDTGSLITILSPFCDRM